MAFFSEFHGVFQGGFRLFLDLVLVNGGFKARNLKGKMMRSSLRYPI